MSQTGAVRTSRMSQMSRIGLVFVAVATWLQVASVVRAEPQPSDYFPLAVGNRWVYAASTGDSTEEWKVIRQEDDVFVVKITADSLSTASFDEFFRLAAAGLERVSATNSNSGNGKPEEMEQPVINAKFQAQLEEKPDALEGQPLFFFKAPVQLGASWETTDGRYEVTGLNETVSVPAGTFSNCVEVMHWSKGGKVTVITSYAPGVGVVQRDETFPLLEGSGNMNARQRQQMVLQLKEWTVK